MSAAHQTRVRDPGHVRRRCQVTGRLVTVDLVDAQPAHPRSTAALSPAAGPLADEPPPASTHTDLVMLGSRRPDGKESSVGLPKAAGLRSFAGRDAGVTVALFVSDRWLLTDPGVQSSGVEPVDVAGDFPFDLAGRVESCRRPGNGIGVWRRCRLSREVHRYPPIRPGGFVR